MTWTSEKLNEYIQKYDVTAREVAKFLKISDKRIFDIRNGELKIEPFSVPLTAYFNSLKKGRILFYRKMIEYYKNLDKE